MAKMDKATAKRMGYEGIVAAQTIMDNGSRIEVCVIGPGDVYGDEYHLAVHVDCNPDSPNEGCSELDACGPNLSDALAAFDAKIEEISTPMRPMNNR